MNLWFWYGSSTFAHNSFLYLEYALSQVFQSSIRRTDVWAVVGAISPRLDAERSPTLPEHYLITVQRRKKEKGKRKKDEYFPFLVGSESPTESLIQSHLFGRG